MVFGIFDEACEGGDERYFELSDMGAYGLIYALYMYSTRYLTFTSQSCLTSRECPVRVVPRVLICSMSALLSIGKLVNFIK